MNKIYLFVVCCLRIYVSAKNEYILVINHLLRLFKKTVLVVQVKGLGGRAWGRRCESIKRAEPEEKS